MSLGAGTFPVGVLSDASLLHILSVMPDGTSPGPLSLEELGTYLKTYYDTDEAKERNARHLVRDKFYRDAGCEILCAVIDKVFDDDDVKRKRKSMVPHTRFNNALKRVVNELATVYTKPAKRLLAKKDQQDKYNDLLTAVRMDEQMLQLSRLLELHRVMLVGFRVRERPTAKGAPVREPVLSLVTPANIRAVLHPNDGTLVVGWAIRMKTRTAKRGGVASTAPAWQLWSAVESVFLREDMSVIVESYRPHPLGVTPYVAVTLAPESAEFWPGEDGEDLVAAHTSIWLVNTLLIKETKSATKQAVLQGDGATMARGQSADSETPLELADGQTITTIDLSLDTDPMRKTSDHVLEHAAQNYGMSAGLINHQGVQSAEARELMRVPLTEKREHVQVPLRRFESELAQVMSAVLAVDMQELTFDPEAFRIEFGAPTTPLAPDDDHNLFEARRGAGLDNTVDQMMRLHPGMDEAEAQLAIERNYEIETTRTKLARPIAAVNGELGGGAQPTPGGAPAAGGSGMVQPIVPPEAKASAKDSEPTAAE